MADIILNPLPAYVIKTLLVKSTENPLRKQGTKVFINVCSDPQIPEPKGGYGDELIRSVSEGNDWIIPIVPSSERTDTDRAGKSCFVWDCCMNPKVIAESTINPAIKVLLVETCIELIEDRSSVELSRDYVLPKLLVKGQLQKTILHSSQLSESEEPKDISLVGGVDSLVKQVLENRSEEQMLESRSEKSQDIKSEKRKPLLIQEISSSGISSGNLKSRNGVSNGISSDSESIEVERSPSLSYKIFTNSQPNLPKSEIQVSGFNSESIKSIEPKLLSNGKISIGDLIAPVPKSTKIEAIFAKDNDLLHIFVW